MHFLKGVERTAKRLVPQGWRKYFRASKYQLLMERLAPVDLVLIEGYKRDRHPKVEAHRAEPGNPLIATGDDSVRAVASDTALELDRPVFDLDDTVVIADFILTEVGLT